MSFARRRRKLPNTDTPDLSVLLAEMSARQGSSRTALVQSRPLSTEDNPACDPLVDIFAPECHSIVTTHRFSDQITNPVIPRKLI